MEISPIPGIRALPAVKAPPADPRLAAVFDIAESRVGDDAYSGGSEAAGGQDDEDGQGGEPAEAESGVQGTEAPEGSRISFFA